MIQLLYIINILILGHFIYKINLFTPNIINKTEENIINPDENNNTDLKYKLMNRDSNTIINPLAPPERRVDINQYPQIQLYEKTRGEPDTYQLLGLLYNDNVDKKYQLYGRQVYPGSYEWEYYIRGFDTGGLDYKFPIERTNKQEIYDNSDITIPIDNNIYKVKLYNFDQPRYNPYVV
jgi:hypothetical protein